MNNRIRWMGLYIVAWTYSCVIGVHTEHLYPKTHVLFPTNWMDFLASKNPSTESGKTIEVKSPSTHHGSIFFIQVDNPLLLAVALSHYHKAYFSGLCKGISPQNMAKNMVQYLHFRILEFPLKLGSGSITGITDGDLMRANSYSISKKGTGKPISCR